MEKPSNSNNLLSMASARGSNNGGSCDGKGKLGEVSGSSFHKGKQGGRRKDFNGNIKTEKKAYGGNARRGSSGFHEKRPKPRAGGGQSSKVNHTLDPDLYQVDMKNIGSKKHNLNHLLNFNLTPREPREFSRDNFKRNSSKKANIKFSKEQFLQANCQFIVAEGRDYSIHDIDPDAPVDWNSVEEVKFNSLSTETTVCPICLQQPVAAKITKCGHIYCWSCILHYMSLSDHKYRKCPICYDFIYKKDLRSVSSVKRYDIKLGDQITFHLMKRKKGNVNVIQLTDSENTLSDNQYCKLFIASPQKILNTVIFREFNELEVQLKEEGDNPEICFIQAAIEELKERKNKIIQKNISNNGQELKESNNSINVEKSFDPDDKDEIDNINEKKSNNNEEYYYFYQSIDGQQIYLNSLNVRMLCEEYGSLEKCPLNITSHIVEMEWSSMTEILRKRHRYMQHLPLTCEFRIAEVELTSPVISQKTIDLYKNLVLKRRQKRCKHAREEQKRERNIEFEKNKKISGIYPLPRYQLNCSDQFPLYDASVIRNRVSESSSGVESEIDVGLFMEHREHSHEEPEFPSFATMLKDGVVKQKPDRVHGNEASDVREEDEEEAAFSIKPTLQYSLSDAFEAALSMKSKGKKAKKKHRK